MGSFIDRNPEKMIAYGSSAKEVIGSIIQLMKKVEAAIDEKAPDLDDRSQIEITKLHECIKRFMVEISKYNDIAIEIKKKGIALKEVVERR